MVEGWILWIIVIVFVGVAFGALYLHRRRFAQVQQQLTDHQTHLEQRLRAMGEQHDRTLGEVDAEHRRQLDAAGTRESDARAREEQFRKLAAKNVDWDLRSRAVILQACDELSIDGVLATNVMFIPQDTDPGKPYVAQLDHVLLTDDFAMIIENKSWAGVVFDGVRPSSEHPAFGALIDEDTLDGAYSVQVIREKDTRLTVRAHTRGDSPRSQVRRHAKQLPKFLRTSTADVPWFRTCVLYSNSRLTLYSAPNPPVRDAGETSIVGGS